MRQGPNSSKPPPTPRTSTTASTSWSDQTRDQRIQDEGKINRRRKESTKKQRKGKQPNLFSHFPHQSKGDPFYRPAQPRTQDRFAHPTAPTATPSRAVHPQPGARPRPQPRTTAEGEAGSRRWGVVWGRWAALDLLSGSSPGLRPLVTVTLPVPAERRCPCCLLFAAWMGPRAGV